MAEGDNNVGANFMEVYPKLSEEPLEDNTYFNIEYLEDNEDSNSTNTDNNALNEDEQSKRENFNTPTTYQKIVNKKNLHWYKKYKNAMVKKNRQLRHLRKKVQRHELKIRNMKDLLKDLKRKNLVTEKTCDSLERMEMEMPKAIFKRLLSGKKCKYSRDLQIFATTVHFYSPKAYNYIRDTFSKSLPSSSTIRRWYSSINCEPGFVQEAFNTLKVKADLMNRENKKCLCTLVVDEMSIMKKIELVGNKIRGYVDFGIENTENNSDEASQAYVFMAVSVNSHWKIPIAYFFIRNLDAIERANLVTDAITRLQSINIEVVCLTCDGPLYNKLMFKLLGSDITLPKPKPYFSTVERPKDKAFTMLDVCHSLEITLPQKKYFIQKIEV